MKVYAKYAGGSISTIGPGELTVVELPPNCIVVDADPTSDLARELARGRAAVAVANEALDAWARLAEVKRQDDLFWKDYALHMDRIDALKEKIK